MESSNSQNNSNVVFENDAVILMQSGISSWRLVSKVTKQDYVKLVLALIVVGFVGGAFAVVSTLGFCAFVDGEASGLLLGIVAAAVCFFIACWPLREALWECLPKRAVLEGETGNCRIRVYGLPSRMVTRSDIEHIGMEVVSVGTPRSSMGYGCVLYLCRTEGKRALRFSMPARLEPTRNAAAVQGVALGREISRILGKPLRQRIKRHWQ